MADDIASLGIKVDSQGVKVASGRLDTMTKSADKAESSVSGLTKAAIALAAAIVSLKTAQALLNVSLETARYESLGIVMGVVGNNVGRTAAEMEKFAVGLQKTGISLIESRLNVTKMAQANIDLAKSSDLARIAQDAAVIGQINSSEAFAKLVQGVQTAQQEVLRTIGINVSFEQSYRKLETQLGKTGGSLTVNEKTQARVNAVMEAGVNIAGVYEASMGSASKQISSLKRLHDDLKVALGDVFSSTLSVSVVAYTKLIKDVSTEVNILKESGKLDEWAIEMAISVVGAVDLMLEAFGFLAKSIAAFRVSFGAVMELYGDQAGKLAVEDLNMEMAKLERITKSLAGETNEAGKAARLRQQARQQEVVAELRNTVQEYDVLKKAGGDMAQDNVKRFFEWGAGVDGVQEKLKGLLAETIKIKKEQGESGGGSDDAEQQRLEKLRIAAAKARIEGEEAAEVAKKAADAAKALADEWVKVQEVLANEIALMGLKGLELELAKIEIRAESLRKKFGETDEINIWESLAVGAAFADDAASQYNAELEKTKNIFDGLDETLSGMSDFGENMSGAFGDVAKAAMDLGKIYDDQIKALDQIADIKEQIAKVDDPTIKAKLERDLTQKQMDFEEKALSQKIGGYREMVGTISQLFDEQSKEREKLHQLELAFAVVEQGILLKKAIFSAVASVANQGSGDPYTAFARVAAMAAVMGGLLSQIGGSLSGGGGSATQAIAPQGSGTVLGDSMAISESASAGYELLEEFHGKEYKELRGIHESMKELNNNITGLIGGIVRDVGTFGGGAVDGYTMGAAGTFVSDVAEQWNYESLREDVGEELSLAYDVISGIPTKITDYMISSAGEVIDDLIGGGTDISVRGGGLIIGGASVADLLEGIDASVQQFTYVREKESSLSGTKRKYYDVTADVSEDIERLFNNILGDLSISLVELSEGLGGDVDKALTHVFELGRINLMGMDTDEMSETLSAVISAAGDAAAEAVLGDIIGKYQDVSEGLLETAIRVYTEQEVVLATLGKTGNKATGDLVALTQGIVEMAGGLENFVDMFSVYYDNFTSDNDKLANSLTYVNAVMGESEQVLPTTREGFTNLLTSLDVTTEAGRKTYIAMLEMSEGISELYSAVEGIMVPINEILATHGLTDFQILIRGINNEFSDLRETLIAAGGTVEQLASLESARLIGLSDAAQAQDAQDAADEQARQDAEEALRLQIEAQKRAEAEQKLREAESALRASFAEAQNELAREHEAILKSLNNQLSDARDASSSLSTMVSSLKSALDSMTMGTDAFDLVQRDVAKASLSRMLTDARAGNFTDTGDLGKTLGVLTSSSEHLFGSFTDYQRDFFRTFSDISELEQLAGTELTDAERTVALLEMQIENENDRYAEERDLLQAQLDALLGISEGVLSLSAAIANFKAAQAGVAALPPAPTSEPLAVEGDVTIPTDGTAGGVQMSSIEDTIRNLYLYSLGREPDEGGLDYWSAILNKAGGDVMAIKDDFFAAAIGVEPTLRTFAVGTDYVPNDMIAQIHQGERITPAAYNRSDATNADLVKEVKQLRADMGQALYTVAKNTGKSAEQLQRWDYDGIPEERVI